MSPRCDIRGCSFQATHRVGFKLYARPGTPPAIGTTDLVVCEACGATLTAQDLMTPDGWRSIVAAFMKCGKQAPDPRLTEIDLAPLAPTRALVH